MYASISASDFRPMAPGVRWTWVDVPVGTGTATVRGITPVDHPERFYVRADVPEEATNAAAMFFVRPVAGGTVVLQIRRVSATGVAFDGSEVVVTGNESLSADTGRGEAAYLTCLLDPGDVLLGVRLTYKPGPGEFVPVTPQRVLDYSQFSTGMVHSVALPIPLNQGVHAAHVNVTVTGTQGAGYLTVWPSGQPKPATSNVAWGAAGQTAAVGTTVGVGQAGGIFISQGGQIGYSRVIIDLTGYYRV
ncbi:hypothetical protein WEI85_30625 [Actinomycetes bacterium KLBMP 9797]